MSGGAAFILGMAAPLLCYFANCSKAPQPTFFLPSLSQIHTLTPTPCTSPHSFFLLFASFPSKSLPAVLTFGPSFSFVLSSLFSSTSIATISSSCSSLATRVWARVVCSFDSQTIPTPRAISRPLVLTLYVLPLSPHLFLALFLGDISLLLFHLRLDQETRKKETTLRKKK